MIFGLISPGELQAALNLLLAAVLGGLIGLEREYKHRPAGLRTLILVSVGAALFAGTAVYAYGGGSDGSARIIANIIVGIGFLGTGAVLKQQTNVHGLTTAASIWAVAAIGMSVALNLYFLAVTAEVLVLVTLFLLRRFEAHMPPADVNSE